MTELDRYRRVLRPQLRAVWPILAEAVDSIDGYLAGGTALAIHLQHRTSFDLDYMTHQPFSGVELFETLNAAAAHATYSRAEPNRMHGIIDGVVVEVFAAPTRGENPGHVQQIAPPRVTAGMRVASLADLLAMKLDVIMYRPKLRDYMDLAAIDSSGSLRLEDGMGLHMRRYGTHPQSSFLDRMVDHLEQPGDLATDPEFASHAERVLGYLASRVPELRAHIKRLRRDLHHNTPPPPRQGSAGLLVKPPAPPNAGLSAAAPGRSADTPHSDTAGPGPTPPAEDAFDAATYLAKFHPASTTQQSVPPPLDTPAPGGGTAAGAAPCRAELPDGGHCAHTVLSDTQRCPAGHTPVRRP